MTKWVSQSTSKPICNFFYVHLLLKSFKSHQDHIFSKHHWRRNGLPISSALPRLSTYLGHNSIDATEKYLRMTAENYPEISEKLSKEYGYLIHLEIKKWDKQTSQHIWPVFSQCFFRQGGISAIQQFHHIEIHSSFSFRFLKTKNAFQRTGLLSMIFLNRLYAILLTGWQYPEVTVPQHRSNDLPQSMFL